VATIEYRATHRASAPRVSDDFVHELRTGSARRPPDPVRPLSTDEISVAVRYAIDEDLAGAAWLCLADGSSTVESEHRPQPERPVSR
jgi:hypothetical protein